MISIDLGVFIQGCLVLGIVAFGYLQYKVSKLEEQVKRLEKFSVSAGEAINEIVDAINEANE